LFPAEEDSRTVAGTKWIQDYELQAKMQELTQTILVLNRKMVLLTWAISALTAISTILTGVSLLLWIIWREYRRYRLWHLCPDLSIYGISLFR